MTRNMGVFEKAWKDRAFPNVDLKQFTLHPKPMPECYHNLPYIGSSRKNTPSLQTVQQYWNDDNYDTTRELFGSYAAAFIPICFGCLQSRDARGEPVQLEKAHLQDACLGGSNSPENIIPLGYNCHRYMTHKFSGCRDCAIEWIQWLQCFTLARPDWIHEEKLDE